MWRATVSGSGPLPRCQGSRTRNESARAPRAPRPPRRPGHRAGRVPWAPRPRTCGLAHVPPILAGLMSRGHRWRAVGTEGVAGTEVDLVVGGARPSIKDDMPFRAVAGDIGDAAAVGTELSTEVGAHAPEDVEDPTDLIESGPPLPIDGHGLFAALRDHARDVKAVVAHGVLRLGFPPVSRHLAESHLLSPGARPGSDERCSTPRCLPGRGLRDGCLMLTTPTEPDQHGAQDTHDHAARHGCHLRSWPNQRVATDHAGASHGDEGSEASDASPATQVPEGQEGLTEGRGC